MLDPREIAALSKLLEKIQRPQGDLPQPVFDALVKVVPFISCELAVLNARGEILLTWRDDAYWTGWHFPGRLIRYGENFSHCIRTTARRELNIRIPRATFLFPMDYHKTCPRGHAVSLVFLCPTRQKPKDGKFFARMPNDIISDHRLLWRMVKGAIR